MDLIHTHPPPASLSKIVSYFLGLLTHIFKRIRHVSTTMMLFIYLVPTDGK